MIKGLKKVNLFRCPIWFCCYLINPFLNFACVVTYSHLEGTNIGDHSEFEIFYLPIWYCVQVGCEQEYVTDGMTTFLCV